MAFPLFLIRYLVTVATTTRGHPAAHGIKEGAGDRFGELEIEIGAYFTFVIDDPAPVLAQFAQMFGMSEDDMGRHPHALFGSVEAICEEPLLAACLHPERQTHPT